MIGKVYCIKGGDETYIGSTFKELHVRFKQHCNVYRHWIKEKKRSFIRVYILFEKYGIDNCVIDLLEEVYTTDRKILLKQEQFYINQGNVVNVGKASKW